MSIFVVVKVVTPVTANVELNVAAPVTPRVDDAVTAPVNVDVPDTFKVPSTINPSLMLIELESSELIVVPANFNEPSTTPPVPAGLKTMFSFDLVPTISFPWKLIAPNVTEPVPDGTRFISSFDRTPSILLSLILIPVSYTHLTLPTKP